MLTIQIAYVADKETSFNNTENTVLLELDDDLERLTLQLTLQRWSLRLLCHASTTATRH